MDMSRHPTRSDRNAQPRAIANWLWSIVGLILLMIAVGGITRLTESGLSITEWKPVTGTVPPLSDAAWQSEFDKYRQSSQYQLMNRGMSLAEFKQIYFWEYAHRLLGRIIGLAFALPLLWFTIRRAVPHGYGRRLGGLLLLGGAQGAVGWLMVRSGLTDRVNVEPAMLAAHLGMALLVMGLVAWTACDLIRLARNPAARPQRPAMAGVAVLVLLFVQMLLGALMAGMRAGHVASDWPLMAGQMLPDGMMWYGDIMRTLTSDAILIHFVHRWWAWGAGAAVVFLASWLARAGERTLALALLGGVVLQIMLGIATVTSGVALPVAVLHQVAGAVLLVLTVVGAHRLSGEAGR